MSVSQAIKHAKTPVEGSRQAVRREELYAADFYGTSQWAGADPTKALDGQKIKWEYDPDTNQGTNGEWKIPENRVPGTPVNVYFDYYMDGGPGGDSVLWLLTYVIVELGGDYTQAATLRTVSDTTLGEDIHALTDPITLDADLFDAKAKPIELLCTFNRWADDPLSDTDPNNAELDKIIFEYTAYV